MSELQICIVLRMHPLISKDPGYLQSKTGAETKPGMLIPHKI